MHSQHLALTTQKPKGTVALFMTCTTCLLALTTLLALTIYHQLKHRSLPLKKRLLIVNDFDFNPSYTVSQYWPNNVISFILHIKILDRINVKTKMKFFLNSKFIYST